MSTTETTRDVKDAVGTRKAPFIQQARLSDEKKTGSPNDALRRRARAPRTAEKKKQRRQQEEAHELLHPHHPWAGLGQKSQPGRLRREQKIGEGHSRGDGDET